MKVYANPHHLANCVVGLYFSGMTYRDALTHIKSVAEVTEPVYPHAWDGRK